MPESLERHAENWDLRRQDFNDNDFLYDVYSVMREQSPFTRTDNPFLSATPSGAWVAVRYAERVKILQDWEHCLGSNLARLEFQVGLERVLSRMPDFTLAPGAQAKFHGNSVTRGFPSVPVAFAPGERSAG